MKQQEKEELWEKFATLDKRSKIACYLSLRGFTELPPEACTQDGWARVFRPPKAYKCRSDTKWYVFTSGLLWGGPSPTKGFFLASPRFWTPARWPQLLADALAEGAGDLVL